jgi:hypothetical protein
MNASLINVLTLILFKDSLKFDPLLIKSKTPQNVMAGNSFLLLINFVSVDTIVG